MEQRLLDGNRIRIEELEVFGRVGVTESERAKPQRLILTITLWPISNLDHVGDDIANTVDYSAVCALARDHVEECPAKLIETLAENLIQEILTRFRARQVRVEVRKFIVPNTRYVSVTLTRDAQN